MITTSLAKSRINQLIANDNRGDKQIDAYYNQSLSYIRDHLTQFYSHYSKANNLTLQQVRSRIDNWSINQWKQAIDQLNVSDWPEQGRLRAKVYSVMAGTTKQKMMIALIGMGMIQMTSKLHNFIKKTLSNDTDSQFKWLKDNLELPVNQKKVITVINQKSTKDIWSENLWTDMDGLANDVEKLVNKHLKHGMSLNKLQSILENHANTKQFDTKTSVADRIHIMDFNARRMVRTESSRLIDEINRTTYSSAGIKQVDVLNQAGACSRICIPIAMGNPYSIYEVPDIPGSTHPNCRCIIIPTVGPYRILITRNHLY